VVTGGVRRAARGAPHLVPPYARGRDYRGAADGRGRYYRASGAATGAGPVSAA